MPVRRGRDRSWCPAQDCQGGRPHRQDRLTDGQRARINDPAREVIDGNPATAYRCSYCGCVCLRGPSETTIQGWLDNALAGACWVAKHSL